MFVEYEEVLNMVSYENGENGWVECLLKTKRHLFVDTYETVCGGA